MGIGDEIMVTGEVKRRAAGTTRRFAIRDPRSASKAHRWHDIWEGNPRIARPGEAFDEWLENFAGWRPYIETKSQRMWRWKPYKPEPGEIFLTPADLSVASAAMGSVIIQPSIKAAASPNKQWPLKYWHKLVSKHPEIPWLQIGDGSEPKIEGAEFLQTRTFREACGALSTARAAVLQEGGLHHAAAAFGKPAVVIFGGFIAPACTGYEMHRNLFVPSDQRGLGCGMRVFCPHCHVAMLSITPTDVLNELEELL